MAEAVVDLGAIAHNTAVVARATGTPVMAVVKADGFGHGAVPVARAALAAGATWLGVASCAEALLLRAAGITAPVLNWLHGLDDDFAAVIGAGVDLAAAAPEHLRAIAAGAAAAGTPAQVHLKVDTGMSRGGAAPADWPQLVALARMMERDGLLRVRGVWSHLARADELRHPSIAAQVARFDEAVGYARAAGLDPPLRHLANSAGALGTARTRYDLVRAGIALYGVEPLPGRRHGLRPALTLRARAVLTKRTPADTGVSYQHTYTTATPTTLVLVPLGYADGVPRSASNRGFVLIGGRRCPVAGVVSMDQFVADAGDLPVRLGDEVIVWGPGDTGEPTVADWARWARTNPHEILTGIGARVPRRYQGMPGQEYHRAG
ncbi:MAG TPA: alanine racemase [Catenuloplanes sp.]